MLLATEMSLQGVCPVPQSSPIPALGLCIRGRVVHRATSRGREEFE